MNTENLITRLKVLNAKHALGLSTSGTAEQRLSLLAGGGVAVGTKVRDKVTGQTVEVLSVGVAYLSEEVLNAL